MLLSPWFFPSGNDVIPLIFSPVGTCRGSCWRFGILLSFRIPKSPPSITSHSLLILGHTLIFLIHELCKHCWAQPTLLVALSPCGELQHPEPWVCQQWAQHREGFGRSPLQSGWDEEQPQISQTSGFPWQLLLLLLELAVGLHYNLISVIEHTRARFNFCPMAVGKLDPNDKAGFCSSTGLVLAYSKWQFFCHSTRKSLISFNTRILESW